MMKFVDSLTFDSRFFYIFLLELLIIALVTIGVMGWVAAANTVADDVESFREDIAQLGSFGALYQDQTTDQLAKDVMTHLFLYSALLIIYVIAVWTSIKYWIYKLILRKKWSWSTYWRFTLVSVLWSIVTFYIFMVIQNAVFLALEANLRGVIAQVILLTVIVIEYLMLFWLTLSLFTALVEKGSMKAGMKNLWNSGIKRFDSFIMPLVISIAVLVVVNLAMYLLGKAVPIIFMAAFTLALILYSVWARLYYMGVLGVLPGSKKSGAVTPVVERHHKKASNKSRAVPEKTSVKRTSAKAGSRSKSNKARRNKSINSKHPKKR